MELTTTDLSALEYLNQELEANRADSKGLTCSVLGGKLWYGLKSHRTESAYARPAGKLMHRLRGMGLVCSIWGRHHGWTITAEGRAALRQGKI